MGMAAKFKLGTRMEFDDPHHRHARDLQPESSVWLFKSPLAGAGHIVAAALQAAQLVKLQ